MPGANTALQETSPLGSHRLAQIRKMHYFRQMVPAQCRMARAALGWTINELARRSRIAPRTVMRIEAGDPHRREKGESVKAALENAGIQLVEVDGRPGVTVE